MNPIGSVRRNFDAHIVIKAPKIRSEGCRQICRHDFKKCYPDTLRLVWLSPTHRYKFIGNEDGVVR